MWGLFSWVALIHQELEVFSDYLQADGLFDLSRSEFISLSCRQTFSVWTLKHYLAPLEENLEVFWCYSAGVGVQQTVTSFFLEFLGFTCRSANRVTNSKCNCVLEDFLLRYVCRGALMKELLVES